MKRFLGVCFAWTMLAVRAYGLEAGAARVEITPPLGTPLNGYYDRLGRGAVSVHDPVWARCLYLDDGSTRLFWVCTDLCVINRELRDRVLEMAPDVVPPEHIFLSATHTHSAQGAMIRPLLFRTVSGRFVPEVLEATASGIAEAMGTAYDARKRAALGYGTIIQNDLSVNRRVPNGPTDPQIGVIRVDDSDGNPIAVLANFAAHPTTVGDDDALAVSADYPGYFYKEIERLYGAGCVAMFANGAQGNQTCANPENKQGWARTESIGRLLAERVKSAADGIQCAEVTLHVGYATPELPPTLAKALLPSSTIVHTLEINNDLLVTFFPGEPCVEIGLELRRRALAAGYKAQFSIGLANDHILYLAPCSLYGKLYYESAMSFYGPRIDEWFYREFSKLMTRGKPAALETPTVAAKESALASGRHLLLTGTPYEIGYQRGKAFSETIRHAYVSKIVEACDRKTLIPDTGLWAWAPPFVNQTPLALPRLAIGARPLIEGLSREAHAEVEGMADGAGLPFDAVWLVQCEPTFAARGNLPDRYRSPFCTMVAAVGDRAGADDVLVGRNLDWPDDDPPIVTETRPDKGRAFLQVGFPWNVGVFTGMNDAGLVLCAERVEPHGEPSIDGAPVELVLRGVLQSCRTLEDAVAALSSLTYMRGYHVLAAHRSGARVIEFGETVGVREPAAGLLLGVDPDSIAADETARIRYGRVRDLLRDERIVSAEEMEKVLRDCDPAQTGRARIFGEHTRHSVVFEAKSRMFRVAFRNEDGSAGNFAAIGFTESKP